MEHLNISGPVISKEDAGIPDHSVCEVSGDIIAASDENLLKQLSQCQHFTPDQIQAIQAIFSSGNTSFGPPSTWTSSVLDELGHLILILGPSILQAIPKSVLMPWLQKAFLRSDLPLDQLVQIRESLKSSRRKRAPAECPEDKTITEEVLNDELLFYTTEELKSCLTKEILQNNLSLFSEYPFTTEQLKAVIEKLDEIFPTEYPPSVVSNLGILFELMDQSNIKKWTIDSPSTLRALLDSVSSDEQRISIIRHYNDLGNQIDHHFLKALGPYICLLNEDQLRMISEDSIKMVTTLDPSNCSQAIKDNLYPKAKRAFSDLHYKYLEYYDRIRPFLGGAPGDDLRALSKNDINMDINTFLGLKNISLK
ncbi:mesothelin, partial [Python bivittatus]|uniref:Mesothelin n=1 Tax=Python bivittatus TaxID=176946 RepID=A0A9F5N6W8_PYTBI